MLAEQKLRKKAEEEEMKKREEEIEERKREEDELFNRLKKEKEMKENEEFDKWKTMFKVTEQGVAADAFQSAAKIDDFVNFVKLRKVVSLQELSGEFKLSNTDLVTRLLQLEEQGRINGIIDDRGKYIYLTEREIASIEKVFVTKGRISKSDLIKECNRLIKFEPTTEDKAKITAERASLVENFEKDFNKQD